MKNNLSWISAAERFPEQSGKYLVYKDGGWDIAKYDVRFGFVQSVQSDPRTWHWMSLPPPPKGNKIDGWISVDAELPQAPWRYLVFQKSGYDIRWYAPQTGFYKGNGITHWMHLPHPPKKKGEPDERKKTDK